MHLFIVGASPDNIIVCKVYTSLLYREILYTVIVNTDIMSHQIILCQCHTTSLGAFPTIWQAALVSVADIDKDSKKVQILP